jgi:hypothetical protein
MELNPNLVPPILPPEIPAQVPVDGTITVEAGHIGKPPISIQNVLRPAPPPPPPLKSK